MSGPRWPAGAFDFRASIDRGGSFPSFDNEVAFRQAQDERGDKQPAHPELVEGPEPVEGRGCNSAADFQKTLAGQGGPWNPEPVSGSLKTVQEQELSPRRSS